ncbi:DUF3800 domain-containing protein [Bradyrhizobium zhanjiangense]|uniref:DUF3800 domain-containing protein n=1 Tax=Bradyrhizobium zhanjiangense TaxID=1325107 RepID=A0ABY0D8M6_9BRAD|nr:DUF3800 domain-containing protein [Bradyrhizobium zhanjiangense]
MTEYVTYFDEVKAIPENGQKTYLVGGIVVPISDIQRIEADVSALAKEIFDSVALTPKTEFHASYIYFGKGPFKGMEPAKRINILSKLAAMIEHGTPVKRVYAAIDTEKLKAQHKAAEFAFAHFCERAQMAIGNKSKSLLIGDLDDQEAKNMISSFSEYRQSGTPWDYGIEMKGFVDTVHFARSHHSRMIQLADVYLFVVAGLYSQRRGFMADELKKALKDKDLHANNYKDWPK